MGKKILLADDSLTIQKVVELTLAGTDYELTCVSNGQKALDALAASRPDLILADVVMPGKNGYEVCEAVKGNPATARIPVVLLSGTFEPFDRERADRIGCDLVVSKPFDAQQLLERIETLLERAPVPQPSFARQEEAPFETASLDDTLPSSGLEVGMDAENPFGRGDEPPREQGRLTAGEREQPGPASREESPAGAVVASSERATEASPEPERHPVEDTPSPVPPAAESFQGEVLIEEISAEEAEVLFDVPYEPEPASHAAAAPVVSELTEEQIERIAARVVEKLSDRVVREIAWEVVPDMAEMAVKRRIKELESGAE
jgi:CheY-like chemotaxis protein